MGIVKLFGNNKDKNKFETKIIGIFSNEKFTSLKINDKIIVYSIEYELGIPIASLDINDDIQLYNFMNHTGLFLLPYLFYYTPDKGIHNSIKYCWNNKYKNRLVNPTDELNDKQTKVVFGILNGRVWKSKFENSDELNKEDSKIIECDEINKKTYNYLIIHSYMDSVSTLFQKATTSDGGSKEEVLTKNLIQWKIYVDNDKIRLGVFKKINTEWESICMRTEIYPYKYKYPGFEHKFIASSLFHNNGIVMLTTFGILIYTFSEHNKSIFLNYFYFMKFDLIDYKYNTITHIKKLQHYKRIFSSTLPLPNYDSFRLDGWVSEIIWFYDFWNIFDVIAYQVIQKAEILAEIELFYLLPHQRRWQTWFPEAIHYYADVDKTRIEIKRLIEEGEWDTKEFAEMREKLLKVLDIKHNPIDNEFYNLITG
ncbi:hypothetical protein GLOIN_2v1767492 [Rhizophagus irregularis DAOM 181602=DAOM 197198]|nr:hypothetical protein GLOIN_2v1767492 [Rhizophagus irregularis DAOM 181602=DAOM 197198]